MKLLSLSIMIAALFTAAILIVGVVLFMRGGKLNAKFSNKLMVSRVLLQALTILILFLLYTLFKK